MLWGLIFALAVTFAAGNTDQQDYSRYYVEVESVEQAEAIAAEMKAELLSFHDGIATYTLNRPIKKILMGANINTFKEEEVATVQGESITLTQDTVYFLDDFQDGCMPKLNPLFEEKPFQKMGWENTYKNGITGKGAVVAVIDTGCNIHHEDLRGNITGGYNATDGTMNVTDENGHGTHVAGTIAALDNEVGNVGVAPDANIYAIKASTGEKGMFYTSDLVRALNKVVELGNINVVNMSLGGYGYNEDFKEAIENCTNHGILCVMAAGNDATNELHYPSAYGYGLGVAAYNQKKDGELAYFSNYGSRNCNIAAPGVDIWSSYKGGDNSYMLLSGTSMATPHVSGIAALIYSQYDIHKTREGADRVRDIIISNNDRIKYSYNGHSVMGGADIQNIFHSTYVRTPSVPKITVTEQKDTGQRIVEFAPTDSEIWYTLDGTMPNIYTSNVYSEPIRLDKSGKYKIRAIAVNKRCSSKKAKEKVTVPNDVISQDRVESVALSCKDTVKAGKTFAVAIKNDGAPIPSSRFKWKSSKPNIATVDKNGIVKVSESAKTGDSFKIKAILGGVKNKVKVTVK